MAAFFAKDDAKWRSEGPQQVDSDTRARTTYRRSGDLCDLKIATRSDEITRWEVSMAKLVGQFMKVDRPHARLTPRLYWGKSAIGVHARPGTVLALRHRRCSVSPGGRGAREEHER